MEPFDYLKILFARWRVVVATVLLALGVGWFTTPTGASVGAEADSYTATATLVRASGSEQSTTRIAVFVTSGSVPVAAAAQLDYAGEPAVLAQSVKVSADDTVGTLEIAVTDADRATAARIANEFVDQLGVLMRRQAQSAAGDSEQVRVLRVQVAEAEKQLAGLDRRVDDDSSEVLQTRLIAGQANLRNLLEQLNEASSQARAEAAPLLVVQRAVSVPDSSTGFAPPTSRFARAALAALGGLALGCALALVVARIDTRLRRRSEVQAAYGLPVLAEIPTWWWRRPADGGIVDLDPRGPVADAYRSLRSALVLSDPVVLGQQHDRVGIGRAEASTVSTMVVVSAVAGEGRTMVTVNLAARLAEAGNRVLIVDCDVRNPQMHRLLGVPAGLGVTDVSGIDPASLARATVLPGVSLIQAGTCDRGGALLPMALPSVVAAARQHADVVLLDCPPMLAATEAMDAMANADAAIVVCRVGRTSRDQAERVQELLARVRIPVFGVALVGSRDARSAPTSGRGWRTWRHRPTTPTSDPASDRSREPIPPLARPVTVSGGGFDPTEPRQDPPPPRAEDSPAASAARGPAPVKRSRQKRGGAATKKPARTSQSAAVRDRPSGPHEDTP
jgi:Mrp family chromosome partitioning ATPase/capsular polysaccharide biosynthesis protein